MLELNRLYKMVIDLSNPIQGYVETTEGWRYLQGYSKPIYIIDPLTGIMPLSRPASQPVGVDRLHYKHDPFSFDVRFTVNIPSAIEGAVQTASVVIQDCQTVGAERVFNQQSVIKFVVRGNKLTFDLWPDIYKFTYLNNLQIETIKAGRGVVILPASESTINKITRLVM